MSDFFALTAIGLCVVLCTLAGDTADDHPVVTAFTWGMGKFDLFPYENRGGWRPGPQLQNQWTMALETDTQWQQMKNFSFSVSLW